MSSGRVLNLNKSCSEWLKMENKGIVDNSLRVLNGVKKRRMFL